MMPQNTTMPLSRLPGVAWRFGAYLLVWLVLIGISPVNLAVGSVAAGCATWVSFALIPPLRQTISVSGVLWLVLRLPWQSLVAGIDVARRALDPRLPLKPGLIDWPCQVPPGPGRDTFRALMCLQPGTLPVGGGEGDALLIHCLDTDQPVAAQLAAEERRFLDLTAPDGRSA